MNMEQIEAFIYVSLTGSFSRAGEILHISQPSVSARIKTLENEMGYPFFIRNGKMVHLTKEGETFLPYAKIVLENMRDAVQAIQQTNSNTKGEIKIATVFTVSNYVLPFLLKEFNDSYPNVKLVINTVRPDHVLDMVLNHEVPLGICSSVNHLPIETTLLFEDELVLAIYPEHPFSSMNTIRINDLANQPFILFNRGSSDWEMINKALKTVGVKPNVVLEGDNIELIKHMVRKKMGIGFLPRFSIEEELQSGDLFEVPIRSFPRLSLPFQVLYLKETKIDGTLKIFYNFLLNKLNREGSRKVI
ncbi:DNA-binding transcriptional LysR family regulator [Bacillus oleivorans]|uniref:DNA-binding transcriptional LysR family regulator n=1 Tax=Bacillus oleivorans TaxID=1448271 RepID=A0A285D4M7_9BACI|nr:LysR family transcriptional regulator [Bacillus oleivorans]SNX74774.1 DNA-binding transcriptional LysR family regulator [Bacillus oleivorans]